MATFRPALIAFVQGKANIMALLPGGVFSSETIFPRGELSEDDVPRKADGVQINTFATIRMREENIHQSEAPVLGAGNQDVEIYVYHDSSYDALDAVINLLFKELNQQYITADDRAIAFLQWVHTSGELDEPALGKAPMMFCRFQSIHIRA